MEIVFSVLFTAGFGFVLYKMGGFGRNYIVLELEDRFYEVNAHREAVIQELQKQNREVEAVSLRTLRIDGKEYILTEKTINESGVPVQRTILKPDIARD
ncbi:hypothetical protein [Alkalicoccus daliensis]|nr:hypothetical protein [Alkalicoccus daliensis]